MLTWLLACADPTPEPAPAPVPEESGPRLILVVIDTMRADHLPFYGYEKETAPFLSRLAAEGVVFEHAWSTSSWTAPSTASIFTGLHPSEHGVTLGMHTTSEGGASVDLNVLPDIPRLPALLKASTAGAASNINIGPAMGFSEGFDRFEYLPGAPGSELAMTATSFDADFVYLHFNDVHSPYNARNPWVKGFGEGPQAAYDSEIAYVDLQLQRLVEHFGWEDDWLIVVTDHGEEFGDHGQNGHLFSLYRELNQVALLVHGPGLSPRRVSENVSLVDVLPTVCELVGVPCPSRSGISLVPALNGEALPTRSLFAHRSSSSGEELWAVIGPEHRLVGEELYALSDRGETTPLDDPEKTRSMKAELEAWQAGIQGHNETRTLEISDETDAMLRTLGYVDP